jgi:hypothetical protein
MITSYKLILSHMVIKQLTYIIAPHFEGQQSLI